MFNSKFSYGAGGLGAAIFSFLFASLSANAAAFTLPADLGGEGASVSPAGFPDFTNLSEIKFQKLLSGGYRLTAVETTPLTFNAGPDASQSFRVTDGNFKLTANFTSDLAFNPAGSSVDITGRIKGYTGPGTLDFGYSGRFNVTNKIGSLFHADLIGFGTDASPSAFGFTTDASDDSGWASQFMTSNESVWFYDTALWDKITQAVDTRKARVWSISLNDIQTVTTVPVPPGMLLFGSALIGLTGLSRRRSS